MRLTLSIILFWNVWIQLLRYPGIGRRAAKVARPASALHIRAAMVSACVVGDI